MKLPLDFIGSMETYLGDEIGPFLAALDGEPVVSIRLNPFKTNPDTKLLVPTEPVPWSRWGYYLEERLPFTLTPCCTRECTTCKRPPPCSWSTWSGNC